VKQLPRCPACNARVVQKSGDGRVRIRTSIVAFKPDGTAEVCCKSCGAAVPIDLQLGPELRKSLEANQPATSRLVVRKGVDRKDLVS
jgi:hypothetical protein